MLTRWPRSTVLGRSLARWVICVPRLLLRRLRTWSSYVRRRSRLGTFRDCAADWCALLAGRGTLAEVRACCCSLGGLGTFCDALGCDWLFCGGRGTLSEARAC